MLYTYYLSGSCPNLTFNFRKKYTHVLWRVVSYVQNSVVLLISCKVIKSYNVSDDVKYFYNLLHNKRMRIKFLLLRCHYIITESIIVFFDKISISDCSSKNVPSLKGLDTIPELYKVLFLLYNYNDE